LDIVPKPEPETTRKTKWYTEKLRLTVCRENLVDIIEGKSFIFREREATPDHGFALDGWDEKCRSIVLDVVREIRVWYRAAGEVIEVSALSGVC